MAGQGAGEAERVLLGEEFPFGMRTEFWKRMEGVEEALQTERAAGAKALRWEQKGSREGAGGAGTCKPPRAGPRPSEATLHQVVEASG